MLYILHHVCEMGYLVLNIAHKFWDLRLFELVIHCLAYFELDQILDEVSAELLLYCLESVLLKFLFLQVRDLLLHLDHIRVLVIDP